VCHPCGFNHSLSGSDLLCSCRAFWCRQTKAYVRPQCTCLPPGGGGDAGLQLPYAFTQPLVGSQCTALLPHHPHLRTGVNSDGQTWATMVAEKEDFAHIQQALSACHTVNGTTIAWLQLTGDSHTCCSRLYPGILCDLR
jgi:hypothetical protein